MEDDPPMFRSATALRMEQALETDAGMARPPDCTSGNTKGSQEDLLLDNEEDGIIGGAPLSFLVKSLRISASASCVG